jgi:transcriptional regulator with XRE-family HTH domain
MTDQPTPHAPRTLRDLAEIPDPGERARAITAAITDTRDLVSELAGMRREAIQELRRGGMLQADVAKLLGVTYGRVSQLEGQPAKVLVQRSIPTLPAVRAAPSLFLAEAEAQGVSGERKMLSVGPTPAPPQVAELLGIEPGALAVRRRKIQRVDGIPVRLPDSWHHLAIVERVPALSSPEFVPGGMEVAFQAAGLRFERAAESLRARHGTEEEAELLEMGPEEDIVVEILRCSYETGGLPVHCLQTVCVACRTTLPVRPYPDDRVF